MACRPETLEEIAAELHNCQRCSLSKRRRNVVFGVGDPKAQLVFVGEGPGREEDEKGEPFVGEAGRLLDRILFAMGLRRDQVYICNVVKCRPPGNRDPLPEEIEHCEPYLRRQLAAINPRVIVALGRFAVQTLLRDSAPISRLRGHWREYEGIALMPTFHPAFLLRNPAMKREVWEDMKQVLHRLRELRG
ncbi:MAG: uracil-DNA glycosylase family protein [Geoalkalibacter sp.]